MVPSTLVSQVDFVPGLARYVSCGDRWADGPPGWKKFDRAGCEKVWSRAGV